MCMRRVAGDNMKIYLPQRVESQNMRAAAAAAAQQFQQADLCACAGDGNPNATLNSQICLLKVNKHRDPKGSYLLHRLQARNTVSKQVKEGLSIR